MDSNTLYEHPFTQTLMDNANPILERMSNEDSRESFIEKLYSQISGKLENIDPEWNSVEQYDVDIFLKTSAVVNCIEKLEQCMIFISQFPRPRTYEKQGINQYTWIHYHYSNYIIGIVSLIDIVLIQVNYIFQLGLRDTDCKYHIILNNKWISKTPIREKIETIKKAIEPHTQIRNLCVHRGSKPQVSRILDTELLEVLNLYSTVQTIHQLPFDPQILDFAYEEEVDKICPILKKEIKYFLEILWALFDQLLPFYTLQRQEILSQMAQ